MRLKRKARGMTLVGFILFLILLGFFAFAGMQIIPVYMEYHSVVSVMKKVANEPGSANLTPTKLKSTLDNYLYTSYVESVSGKDFKVTRGQTRELHVNYEVRKDFIGNLDFIMSFDKKIPLK